MILVLLLGLLSSSRGQCVYNLTHCSCTVGDTPGKCLRRVEGGVCNVDNCASNGHICDCAGSSICEVYICETMLALDGSPNSAFSVGDTIQCSAASTFCLSPPSGENYSAQSTTLSPSATPPPLEPEYRMVQWGENPSLEDTFNLSQIVDNIESDNWLRNAPGADGVWRHRQTERRVITIRVYDNVPGAGEEIERMICAIYNPNTGVQDGMIEIQVSVTVTGESGQQLTWHLCDDSDECSDGYSGNILKATHTTTSEFSDGFCIGPLGSSGDVISIRFTEITGITAVAFEDTSGVVKQYNFTDVGQNGLSAVYVDMNGLAMLGATPLIRFNWQGFSTPL